MKKIVSIYLSLLLVVLSCEKEKTNNEELPNIVTYPAGGEVFIREGLLTIEWRDNNSSNVRIRLYKGQSRILNITESVSNTGKYSWIIPTNIADGKDYKVKIFSNDNDFVSYESKEFKILGKSGVSTFTDVRDNQVYKIIKIGNQWWFAQDFNYQTASGSWENPNNPGRFYNYQAAKASCPDGWQLPSDNDWKILEEFVGIKSTELNSIGARGRHEGLLLQENGGLEFDIKFSGYFDFNSNLVSNSWYEANFWTSSVNYNTSSWIRRFSFNSGSITRTTMYINHGLSVRYCKYEK